MKHFTTAKKISEDTLYEIFNIAEGLEVAGPEIRFMQPLKGFVLANLFYEPSTRTSSSFYAAMTKLGGSCIPINEVQYSSVSKGENLEDTIRTMGSYTDAIVLRSLNAGDAEIAASVSTVPIINAGDGSGEHPTQTLLDLYTIYKHFGRITDLRITFAGDIENGRTVHSLAEYLEPTCYITLAEHYDNTLENSLSDVDVLYMTRLQKERGTEGYYALTEEMIEKMNPEAIVLHPFPRNQEIPRSFDNDKRAKYFEQMQNGLFIRMSLLQKILINR